jgi:hydrogenase maturation factor
MNVRSNYKRNAKQLTIKYINNEDSNGDNNIMHNNVSMMQITEDKENATSYSMRMMHNNVSMMQITKDEENAAVKKM